MANLELKQGEAKNVKFTVTDVNGNAVDISAATLKFAVKQKKADSAYVIEKDDGDFDKTDAESGIALVTITAVETLAMEGNYRGELRISFSSSNIDKSEDILIEVLKGVIT